MYFLSGVGSVPSTERWVRARLVGIDRARRTVELRVSAFKPGRQMPARVAFRLCGGGRPSVLLEERQIIFGGQRGGYPTNLTLSLEGYDAQNRMICVQPLEGGRRFKVPLSRRVLRIAQVGSMDSRRSQITVVNDGFEASRPARIVLYAQDDPRRVLAWASVRALAPGARQSVIVVVPRSAEVLYARVAGNSSSLNTAQITHRLR